MHRTRLLPPLTVLALVGCATGAADSGDSGVGLVSEEVVDALAAGGAVDLLVRVDDSDIEAQIAALRGPGDRAGDRRALRDARALAWAERAEELIAELPPGVEPRRVYTHFPVVEVRLSDLADAEEVAALGDVLEVEPDVVHQTFLTQTLALIDQPAAVEAGFGGGGASVVVIDTGADWKAADLGSCSAVGSPASCRVVYAADFASDDGSRDDNGHGTNVSSIVARTAPDADIVALDVFTGTGAFTSDILEALDWVVAYRDTYDIAAVNMSLGAGAYSSTCANSFSAGVAAVRAAGVSVVVASGNNAYTSAIASPACVEGALSVGAVYDANVGSLSWSSCSESSTAKDKVTCFSNSSEDLDILAPGAFVSAGGYTMSGTSMAAPHVAGAMALLRAADPSATVDELEERLLNAGASVTDARNGITFPRLDVDDAVMDCVSSISASATTLAAAGETGSIDITGADGCAWEATSDASWLTLDGSAGAGSGTLWFSASANTGAARTATVTLAGRTVSLTQSADAAPTGTVSIASGATGTRTGAVTVSLSASDATGGVSTMCLSNTTTCSTWQAYTSSVAWALSSGSGTKTVYAWFRDAYGNTSAVASDTIVLDATAPTNGTLTSTASTGAVALSWSGFSDSGSGIASYKVMQAASSSAPSNCTSGTAAWTGTGTSATISGLTDGTTYSYRVCAVDGAGNTSSGATTSVIPTPETTAPTGSIRIASGAEWTKTQSVSVALTASDASGVSYACLSNTSTCSSWFAMASTKTWSLSSGAGTKTVYAWFKDAYGNVSTVTTDTIALDSTAPTNGTVTGAGSSGAVALSWTGFSDAGSGIASYKVVMGASTPSSCSSGTLAYSGTGTSATVSGLTNGTTYGFRVCAIDTAGNTSTGATASVRPAPEYNVPTGSFTVNGGAAWTNSRTVTITPAATDDSGVASMCFANSTTCSSFSTYATSTTFSLSSTAGTRTVYGWFKDVYGNVSVVATDTIGYDGTKPSGGALAATMGTGEAALSWSGFSDATSGVASYKVVYAAGSAPSSCSAGTVAYEGTATTVTVTGLTAGTNYGFRACAIDTAGNVSNGVSASGMAG